MNLKSNNEIILATASPRRRELFSKLEIPFDVITSDVEETSVPLTSMESYVQQVALLKARDVGKSNNGKVVIGADTIVVYKNTLLHKPKNYEEAVNHLHNLSNNQHQVMTGVAIILPDGTEKTFVEVTDVYFKKLSSKLIEKYVESGDPFDKAGGYGIQTNGALFVDRIEGDYNNVVGLPLATLFEQLVVLNVITI